ncbi:hypothetical protein M3Y95_00842800 [Aphelenchoides besseyi]|nr:hypothetical protein M3Y95_00842800 [Aphelenchoides besseyi]
MLRFSIWLLVVCGSMVQAQKCIEGRNITGQCPNFQVAVKSNGPEMKATLFIAPGKNKFNGTIKIGSCEIKSMISSGNPTQTITLGSGAAFSSPIEIVASQHNVTMKGKGENAQPVCSTAPFTLTDGKVNTTVGLNIQKTSGANLVLDNSVDFVVAEEEKDDGPDVPVICGIVGGVALLFIALSISIGSCCWCKKDKKKDLKPKKKSQKKPTTKKSVRPTPVQMAQPKASIECTAQDNTMRTAEGATSQSTLDAIGGDRARLIVQAMKKRSDKEHEKAVDRVQEASQRQVAAKADPFIAELEAETKKLEAQLKALESQEAKDRAAIAATKSKIAEYKQRKAKLDEDTLHGVNDLVTASTQASATTAHSTVTAAQPSDSNVSVNNTTTNQSTNDVTSKEATENKI